MMVFLISLGIGAVGFLGLLFGLERQKAVRNFWLSRTLTSLLVAVLLWKLTPLWTRWDAVFDNPLLLVSMNGGLAAVLGGIFAFVTVGLLSVWQATKEWPSVQPWRLGVPSVVGLVLVGLVNVLEPTVVPLPGTHPGPSLQSLVPDLDGKQHALADWRGRVVVVNFWTTWCPPCLAELPEFQAFTQVPSTKVAIVGVDVIGAEKDDVVGVARFVADKKMAWAQLTDPNGELQKAFEVTSIPTTVVLDSQGRVVDRREGAVDLFWLKSLEGRFASH